MSQSRGTWQNVPSFYGSKGLSDFIKVYEIHVDTASREKAGTVLVGGNITGVLGRKIGSPIWVGN